MAFKVGQELVCVDTNWGEQMDCDPKEHQIVVVESIYEGGFLFLVGFGTYFKNGEEWRSTYEDVHFEPLVDFLSEQSDFDLWRIEQEIEEEIMQPA